MKKLFLSSSFSTVAKLFIDFAGPGLKGKTVTFIPTAAAHEEIDFYVKSGKKALEKAGLIVEELDVANASASEIREKLEHNDFIYVSGGNTFFLLQELKKKGADRIIADQINSGKMYIGESAGSMVLAPNIEYVKDMDDCNIAPELSDFNALHVIDFYPLPHYTNFPFKKVGEKIVAKYQAALPLKPISNAQAILVDGDRVEVQG